MKNFKVVIISLLLSFIFSSTSSYTVEGMICGVGCVNKIEKEINSLQGVKKCKVDFENGMMEVEYDETKIAEQDIAQILNEKTTYKCAIKEDNTQIETTKESSKGFFRRILDLF